MSPLFQGLAFFIRSLEETIGRDTQCIGKPDDNIHGYVLFAAFDTHNSSTSQTGCFCQLLLRPTGLIPKPADYESQLL